MAEAVIDAAAIIVAVAVAMVFIAVVVVVAAVEGSFEKLIWHWCYIDWKLCLSVKIAAQKLKVPTGFVVFVAIVPCDTAGPIREQNMEENCPWKRSGVS